MRAHAREHEWHPMHRSILFATRTFTGGPPQTIIRSCIVMKKVARITSIVSAFEEADNLFFCRIEKEDDGVDNTAIGSLPPIRSPEDALSSS